jgi:hypothetical protein
LVGLREFVNKVELANAVEFAHIRFVPLRHAGRLQVAHAAGGQVMRYWRSFIATSPSAIWQWYRSICTFKLAADWKRWIR